MKKRIKKIYDYIKDEYKFILLNIILILIFAIQLPYVINFPGSITNLSEKIVIDNGYQSKGSINGTYVRSIKPSLPFLILALILPNWDIETQKSQVLTNEDYNDMELRSKVDLEVANNSAILVVLKTLDIPYEIVKTRNIVTYIYDKNTTTLHLNDEIIAIDDVIINNLNDLHNYIEKQEVGAEVKISIMRNNKKSIKTAKIITKNNQKIIGILMSTTYEIKTKYNINVEVDKNESGPSAGLMTSLAIYDALTKEDLTKGRVVAGTGTIDIDGNVGAIGGIKYKLIGAAKKNVSFFLVPDENYEEAIKINKTNKLNLDIYGVKTFNDAIEILNNY